jgi:hypothetical protein
LTSAVIPATVAEAAATGTVADESMRIDEERRGTSEL